MLMQVVEIEILPGRLSEAMARVGQALRRAEKQFFEASGRSKEDWWVRSRQAAPARPGKAGPLLTYELRVERVKG